MASDGEVLISVNLQVDEAQKQLDAFAKKGAKAQVDLGLKSTELEQARAELEKLQQTYDELQTKVNGMQMIKNGKVVRNATYDEDVIKQFAEVGDKLGLQKTKVDGLQEEYDKLNGTIKECENAMRELQKFIDENDKGDGGEEESGEGTEKATSGIGKMLTSMLKRVFVFSVITSGLRAVRSAMQQLLMSNTELQTSFRELKGNLLTLAQPIISVLIPAINMAVQALSALIQTIGSVVFSIFGLSWAGVAKNAEKMSKSMKSTAGSAKQIRSLMGIDEINRLDDNSGGGGGASSPIFGAGGNFDFGKMFTGILDGITGVIEKIATFLTSNSLMGWADIGQAIYGRIRDSIVWVLDMLKQRVPVFMASLGKLTAGLITSIGGLIFGFLRGMWEDITAWLEPYTIMAGGNWIGGLFIGILDGMANIFTWIKENVFQPFIDAFCKWFKIESPSKVMEELGQYLVEGLKNGVKGIWDSIKQYFLNIYEGIKTIMGNAWQNMKDGALGAWNRIKEIFSNVKQYFKDTFSQAWEGIKAVFSGEKTAQIASAIGDAIRRLLNGFINGVNNVISVPFTTLRNAFNNLRNVSILGASPFSWLPYISIPRIPQLAQGTVVPPNRQFLAMLGDNKTETEVVSPLSTMKEALAEALAESSQHITVNIDGRQLFDIVVGQNNAEVRRTGQTPLMV